MQRFANPLGRVLGAAGSWLVFAFFFTGLFQVSGTVIGLGGYCASGGPYVIETECPEAVVVFAPLGVFGMFLAAGIAIAAAHDFAAPLLGWAWTILFAGLGIQFLLGAFAGIGIVSNGLIGVLFVAMGVVPLVIILRAGGLRTLLVGNRTILGEPFVGADASTRLLPSRVTGEADPVTLTPGHALLGVGIPAVAAAGGVTLSVLAVRAMG